jgi:predicted DNA-binding antitoxin AbrB/MazE fold protein
MSKNIEAIYEDGVLKPLQKVSLKEHEKVEIQIFSPEEWQKRFKRVIEKIHKKTAQFKPKEIESDIAQAVKEYRDKKRGH